LKIYTVSDLVKCLKTDDPRCIEPVRIDREFFERQRWVTGEFNLWREWFPALKNLDHSVFITDAQTFA
jgi:hypothetical protein